MKLKGLLLLSLLHTSVFAQRKFTLDQCYEFAFKNNYDIKGQELAVLQAENSLNQSKRVIFPTVSGSFSQGLNSGRSIDPFTNTFVQRSISSNSFGAGFNWNIFNGFARTNQIEQNKRNLEAEYYVSQQDKRDLKSRIMLAYMKVLMDQELWKIASEQENSLLKNLEVIKEKVKEGLLPKTDIIDFEAQLASAAFDALNARNTIEVSKRMLAQQIGLKDFQNIEVEPVDWIEKSPDSQLTHRLFSGLDNQPTLKAMDLKLKSAALGIKIVEATRSPTVSLGGGIGSAYSSAASSEFNYFNQLNYNFNQYLRLGINFPIYNGGQTTYRITAAGINYKIAKNQYDKLSQDLKLEIEQAYLSAKIANEKLKSAEINLNAQQLAFESANERFNEGILNSTDLNTFRLNFEKAKSSQIQARYEARFRGMLLELYLD